MVKTPARACSTLGHPHTESEDKRGDSVMREDFSSASLFNCCKAVLCFRSRRQRWLGSGKMKKVQPQQQLADCCAREASHFASPTRLHISMEHWRRIWIELGSN